MAILWKKHFVAFERFESCGLLDVNGDGKPEIVSGEYWYERPEAAARHRLGTVAAYGEYYDDFSTLPMDVNGDGRLDFITGGWFGNTLRWRENPGMAGTEWPEHIIAETGNIETTRAWDVDRDGRLEIVPNTPGGPLVVYQLVTDGDGKGTGTFRAHTIFTRNQGHGLGFGDVSGSGRGDFVLFDGWLEAPEDPYQGEWIFHPEFNLGTASVPVIVADVNGDGLNDLIVGQAHGYGLDWYEQKVSHDQRSWVKHPIDPYNSQYHDLQWIDIDGDGENELITGKRYRAHNGRDAGEFDAVGIYYFKWNG